MNDIKKTTQLNDETNHFIACQDCAMESVCKPIKTGEKNFDVAQSYLSKRVEVEASKSLFVKNEALSAIYAVCSGTFKLTDVSENNQEKIVGFRFPGELIGEDSLYPDKYGYNAVAIGKSSVCRVEVSQLLACSNAVPELQLSLVKLLTRQGYTNQTEFHALIAQKSADSLLAAFLLNVSERKAAYDGSTSQVNLTMSRDNIANFLGLRRETLSRILSKFQKEDLINITGKRVDLLAAEQLRKTANL